MEVSIRKTAGVRNDMLVTIARSELDDVCLGIARRDRLRDQPGLVRHRALSPEERERNAACKAPIEEHLAALELYDPSSGPVRPVFAVGNRNLGNNHGVVAWQHKQAPRLVSVRDDPLNGPAYSCLVWGCDGALTIQNLRFDPVGERVARDADGTDLTDAIVWATSGQRILHEGRPVSIDANIEQFYDIRHVFAYDLHRLEGRQAAADLYADYPKQFRSNALRAWRERGLPRSRYLHNTVGLSNEYVYILQREGTPEELANWLLQSGAKEGIILDNGGSVSCWAWWIYPHGGFLFAAPDFRPMASSVVAFVLKGPVWTDLPGGSVSYAIV